MKCFLSLGCYVLSYQARLERGEPEEELRRKAEELTDEWIRLLACWEMEGAEFFRDERRDVILRDLDIIIREAKRRGLTLTCALPNED